MNKIKLPNPVVIFLAAIAAFWIADIMNPGFNPIGVMILMLIPVIIVEILYPQPALESLIEQEQHKLAQQQLLEQDSHETETEPETEPKIAEEQEPETVTQT